MSYSPARLDEIVKPEGSSPALKTDSEAPVPSWFTLDQQTETSDQLVQRYRERVARQEAQRKADSEVTDDYRRNLDSRFKVAKALYDKPGNDNPPEVKIKSRRPTLPLSEIEGRAHRYNREAARISEMPPAQSGKITWRAYLSFAILAMTMGSAVGFGYANRDRLVSLSQKGLEQAKAVVANFSTMAPATTVPVATGSTVILKKPISMASLSVNDAAGTLNTMIPLALAAHAASAEQPVDILISGLPTSAYLTAGRQVQEGSWLVKVPEMADLKLVVPQSPTPKISLDVTALEQGTSNLAAPMQKLSVEFSDVKITPASATPDEQGSNIITQPAAALDNKQASAEAQPIPQPIGSELLVRADGLMNQGDIISARQYYMQAANVGSARGMLGVARSYDPKVFAEMKIEGLQPDTVKAAEWYKKAKAAGLSVNN